MAKYIDTSPIIDMARFIGERFPLESKNEITEEFMANMPLAANNAEFIAYRNLVKRTLVVKLKTWILAGEHKITEQQQVKTYPTSLWQYLKWRFAPQWFQVKYPVDWWTKQVPLYKHVRVCPHANIKFPPDCKPHIDFLRFDSKGDDDGEDSESYFDGLDG